MANIVSSSILIAFSILDGLLRDTGARYVPLKPNPGSEAPVSVNLTMAPLDLLLNSASPIAKLSSSNLIYLLVTCAEITGRSISFGSIIVSLLLAMFINTSLRLDRHSPTPVASISPKSLITEPSYFLSHAFLYEFIFFTVGTPSIINASISIISSENKIIVREKLSVSKIRYLPLGAARPVLQKLP